MYYFLFNAHYWNKKEFFTTYFIAENVRIKSSGENSSIVLQISLKELSEFYFDKNIKGEVVLLVAGAGNTDIDRSEIEQHVRDALKSMSVKDSAEAVAIAFNVPRRDIYQLALQIKSGGD